MIRDRLLSIASPLLLVALWEASSRLGLLNEKFFPPPSAIVGTFGAMVTSGELLAHTQASLLRTLGGFAVGALPAMGVGLAMGLYKPVRLFLMPLAAAIYPIPKIALLPLVIVLFGLGETSKIVIVAISVFFLVLLNTMVGVMNINPIYMDVGRNFGARALDRVLTIALPGALPMIMAGFKLAMGFALIVIVGAEFLGAKSGLGFLIWQSYQTFHIEAMFVGLVTTALLGWLLALALDELERWLIPWNQQR